MIGGGSATGGPPRLAQLVRAKHALRAIAVDLRVTQTVDGHKGIDCILSKASLPKR
jgi:hypothetical protein